jgi:hypothetical protein
MILSWANCTNSTAPGTTPFVRQWTAQRETWARQLARSLLWWYRQHYQIPRHDPRLDELTWEELWIEYRAWEISQTPPALDDDDDDVEDAFLRAARAGEVNPHDPASRRAWLAAWHAAHPTAPEEAT